MARFTDPLALYRHQKAAFEATTTSARAAWRQIPEGAYRDFKELTSGGISSATLRRMGHPYARRIGPKGNLLNSARGTSASFRKRNPGLGNTRGLAPVLPVNRQSGKLQRSVTLYRRSSRYTLEESVGFDAGKAGRSLYAVAPTGTRRVVPRGVFVEVRKRASARNRAYRDVFIKGQRAAFSKP